jgi:hypothetical protein
MSQGKYSPAYNPVSDFIYNFRGELPNKFGSLFEDAMFADFDKNGYDRYGYSSFNQKGDFVGFGLGVDANGKTEEDYLLMDSDEFEKYC